MAYTDRNDNISEEYPDGFIFCVQHGVGTNDTTPYFIKVEPNVPPVLYDHFPSLSERGKTKWHVKEISSDYKGDNY